MYYFIEPMAEHDIEQVQRIERQSFSTLWSANTYRTELRSSTTSRYIVARASPTPPPPRSENTQRRRRLSSVFSVLFGSPPLPEPSPHPIVGYGGLWLSVDEGHITTIAVDPTYRGRGIGELLLNGLTDQAMAMNADILTLEVRVSNVVAQQLYNKYGFKPFGTRPRYYTDNSEDALIMSTESIRSSEYQELLHRLRELLFERLRSEAAEPAPTRSGPTSVPLTPPISTSAKKMQ